jgi:uncharacterized protein with NAD-binding domain and iron-sulfur cluster
MGKRRIAVLGGGTGSLVAAYELTGTPALREQHEVTVYQQGWRLGGKGASGRDMRPGYGHRILEHGLHVWAGFYENAFALMRDCYREAERPPGSPLSVWHDPDDPAASAFLPHDHVTLSERVGDNWVAWPTELPSNHELPGEDDDVYLDPWSFVEMTAEVVIELVDSALEWNQGLLTRILGAFVKPREGRGTSLGRALAKSVTDGPADEIRRALPPPSEHEDDDETPGIFLTAIATALKSAVDGKLGYAAERSLAQFIDQFRSWLGRRLRHGGLDSAPLRRIWILSDLLLTHLCGLLSDRVLEHGLEAINDVDWHDWLKHHGASEVTLESPMVRGVYEYVFGFVDGDATRPALEAGTAVNGIFRLALTYKGSIFWEMQGGMGDVIFAPLYEVLRKRGVRFEFFHRVDALHLSDDKRYVQTIDLNVQATLVDPAAGYQPLFDVRGAPCWPDRPLHEQLVEAEQLGAVDLESALADWPGVDNKTLLRGRDFDDVVLGISLAALPPICSELIDASAGWRWMVDNVRTVQTQAMQLWLNLDTKAMGWDGPATLLTAYARPFATWADMSFLVDKESWRPGQVGSIAYFCGPLADRQPDGQPAHAFLSAAHDAVQQTGEAFIANGAQRLWPRLFKADPTGGAASFDWDVLLDPEGRNGKVRFDAQYFRANTNPTDRYVLSVPGSSKHRLPADDASFANLFLAGDWVHSGMNAGCIEGAAMAGRAASRAICGNPATIVGEQMIFATGQPSPVARSLPVARPRYIERGGEQVFRQPLVLYGASLNAFMLDADMTALEKLCDERLNGPAAGRLRYIPLTSKVALVFANIAKASSTDPHDAVKGWIPEIDVAFWIPLLVTEPDGRGGWEVRDVRWWLPYVFVDNAWAMATGREIYGFAKQLGEFNIPSDAEHGAYTVSTTVLDPFHPDTRARMRQIVSVRKNDSGSTGIAKIFDELGDAGGELIRTVFDGKESLEVLVRRGVDPIKLPLNLLDYLKDGKAPMVFLKQFRAAGDPTRACYQRLIHAAANIIDDGFDGGGLMLGDYTLTLADFASQPIARDLGLKVGDNHIDDAYWVKFSFVMEEGTEV